MNSLMRNEKLLRPHAGGFLHKRTRLLFGELGDVNGAWGVVVRKIQVQSFAGFLAEACDAFLCYLRSWVVLAKLAYDCMLTWCYSESNVLVVVKRVCFYAVYDWNNSQCAAPCEFLNDNDNGCCFIFWDLRKFLQRTVITAAAENQQTYRAYQDEYLLSHWFRLAKVLGNGNRGLLCLV